MTDRLLLCTDLDRTLIPNGPQSESTGARQYFAAFVGDPRVKLAYVSGRHRALVERAISNYRLPIPDFVIGDVGTTLYEVGQTRAWQLNADWEQTISTDWGGRSHGEVKSLLVDVPHLRIQEIDKQNAHKLSYYVPLHVDTTLLDQAIAARLKDKGVGARLIWSVDEPAGLGLLDIVPESASKFHAIEALMALEGFDRDNTVFSGDSGNDMEVLVSPISAILVANAQEEVRDLALRLIRQNGHEDSLYMASGEFHGMNGNYGAGILEGVAHYHPDCSDWMGFEAADGS